MGKICSKCKQEKDTSEFYKRSTAKDGLQRQCIACAKDNDRKYYDANKTTLIEHYKRQRRTRIQRFKQLFKTAAHCLICGEADPVCLDFHHTNPADKEFTISTVVADYSWNRLLNEIEKCVIVCRNCHAKLHEYGDEYCNIRDIEPKMIDIVANARLAQR